MKTSRLDMSRFHVDPPESSGLKVRSQREDLIAQIVADTIEPDKPKLAKALAVAANTLQWTETELHALLKKKQDPSIRNFTAFVWWSCKVTNQSENGVKKSG